MLFGADQFTGVCAFLARTAPNPANNRANPPSAAGDKVGIKLASTVMLAVAVLPGPASSEVTVPVVLTSTPSCVLLTFTDKLHDWFGCKFAVAMLTLPDPATAVTTPWAAVLQVPAAPLGVATTRPAGKVSVKPTPLIDVAALGLVIVNVRLVVPLTGMLAAPNTLLMVGGVNRPTLTEAVAVLPVPWSDVTAPVVLVFVPTVVPVTFSEKLQTVVGPSAPPVRVIAFDPAVAVTVPPQLLVRLLGVATTRPAGKLSISPTPVRPGVGLPVTIEMVSREVPPNGMFVGKNCLVMKGGPKTFRVAVAAVPLPWDELTGPVVLV